MAGVTATRGKGKRKSNAHLFRFDRGAEQRVERLSAGERGRVAIARAVAARPALLLADEPSSRLDQANALAVAALLRALARDHGAAVVCATHDPLVIEQADAELALRGPVRMSAALIAG